MCWISWTRDVSRGMPVDCCIPDEDIRESEEELLERAKKLHPDQDFPALAELTETTSLFHNPDRKNAHL